MPIDFKIEEALAHSFKDYHVKGFDYICLRRGSDLTLKLYAFRGDVARAPEVVNPHDHRYDFRTHVLAGRLTNYLFVPCPGGTPYHRHNYKTLLNGGNGFTYAGRTHLRVDDYSVFGPSETCEMLAEQIHTIQVKPGTVLLLEQYEDRRIEATSTFTKLREAPSLDGMYSRFTEAELIDRLTEIAGQANLDIWISDYGCRFYNTPPIRWAA